MTDKTVKRRQAPMNVVETIANTLTENLIHLALARDMMTTARVSVATEAKKA